MEDSETAMADFIEHLSEGLLRNKHGDVPTPVEISASPEEGVSPSSARFFGIKQPDQCAAQFIDLATRIGGS